MRLFNAYARRAFTLLLSTMVLTAGLGACAIATQATVEPADPQSRGRQIAADQGGVLFRFNIGSAFVSRYVTHWDMVRVEREQGPGAPRQFFDIERSDLGAFGSDTYFGELPAGTYSMGVLISDVCDGVGCVKSQFPFRSDALKFKVEKGKISYIGDLIYLKLSETSTRVIASGPKDVEPIRNWILSHSPMNAALPLVDGRPDEQPVRDEAIFRRAQSSVDGLLNPVTTPSGDVLFTTLSSNIRVFDSTNAGRSIQTGISGMVNTILPLSEKQWMVGGDFGEVRITHDAGRTWEDAKLGLPYAAIRGLFSVRQNEIIAVLQMRETVSVYSGSLDGGAWKQRTSNDFRFSSWFGGSRQPLVVPDLPSKRLLLMLPGNQSFFLNLETFDKQAIKFSGAGVYWAKISGDKVIRSCCNRVGARLTTWETRDEGKTWQDSGSELAVPQFRDSKVGFNTTKFDIQRTHDGGATWVTVHQQEPQYWPFLWKPYTLTFIHVSDQKILATDGMHRLLLSEDAGNTWRGALDSGRR